MVALLSKTQEATPRFESRTLTEDETIPLNKAVQEKSIGFISRAAIDESARMARKTLWKEPAWRAVEDLPYIPKILYQLAGKCGILIPVVSSPIVSTNAR